MAVPSVGQTSQQPSTDATKSATTGKLDAPDSPTGQQSYCPSIASNNTLTTAASTTITTADARPTLDATKKRKDDDDDDEPAGSTRSMPSATPPLKSTFVRKGAKTTMVTKQKDGKGDEFFISISFDTEAAAKATAAEEERLRERYHSGTQRRPYGTASNYEYVPYGVTLGQKRRPQSEKSNEHVDADVDVDVDEERDDDDDSEHDDADDESEGSALAMDEEAGVPPPPHGSTLEESSPLFGTKIPFYHALPSEGDEEEGVEVVPELPPTPIKTLPATPSTSASADEVVVVQKERRLSTILICVIVTATILLALIAFVIVFQLRLRNDSDDDEDEEDAFVDTPVESPKAESSITEAATMFSGSNHEED